jgi:hypothetical protein
MGSEEADAGEIGSADSSDSEGVRSDSEPTLPKEVKDQLCDPVTTLDSLYRLKKAHYYSSIESDEAPKRRSGRVPETGDETAPSERTALSLRRFYILRQDPAAC